jgi:hypothetical protein
MWKSFSITIASLLACMDPRYIHTTNILTNIYLPWWITYTYICVDWNLYIFFNNNIKMKLGKCTRCKKISGELVHEMCCLELDKRCLLCFSFHLVTYIQLLLHMLGDPHNIVLMPIHYTCDLMRCPYRRDFYLCTLIEGIK